MVTARIFSGIYALMGLLDLFMPHIGYQLFVHAPKSVDKLGWYYLEPLVRCAGLASIGLAFALYTLGHVAMQSDQSMSQCVRKTTTAILGTKGVGYAILAYMYPELRTMATIIMMAIHHIAVGTEMMGMMGSGAMKAATKATEGTKSQ